MNVFPLSMRKTTLAMVFLLASAAAWVTLDAAAPDDKERAAAALEQDVKADPNNAELWQHLGYAYRKEGQVDKAQNAFEKVVTLNPRSDNALYMLGLIYEKKRQTQDALRIWRQYLTVETNPAERAVAEKHIHQLSQ